MVAPSPRPDLDAEAVDYPDSGDGDFVIHFEHEFGLAVIHLLADHTSLEPRALVTLMRRLRAARDELRRSGYSVECEPPLVGD